MIYIKGLRKKVGNNDFRVEKLKIEKGKIYSIVGHNGSGKSTLLKILYNIETFEEGCININNEYINIENVYKYMAYNPQESRFLNTTLQINYDYIYRYSENKQLLDKNKLLKLIMEFNLEDKVNTNIKELSGGEKAKAQFIRTLIMNKQYNLLDEAMSNMDINTIKKVEDKILKLKKEGKTVVLVTHDISQANRISDYIILMENLNHIGTYKKGDFF